MLGHPHAESAERAGVEGRRRGLLSGLVRGLRHRGASSRHIPISRGGYALVATGLEHCLAEGGLDSVDAQKMEKLFLALA
jgi:hypothetical protein